MAAHDRRRHARKHGHPKRWRVNRDLVLQAFDRRLVRTLLFVVNVALIATTLLLPPSPTPLAAAEPHGVQESVRIAFTKPVLKDTVRPELFPSAGGTWEYVDPILGSTLYRGMVFTPAGTLLPDTRYVVRLGDARSLTSLYPSNEVVSFDTGAFPAVTASSLADGATDVAACEPITLTLDRPVATAGTFTVSTEPARPLAVELSENGSAYTVRAADCFEAGLSYVLTAEPSLPDTAATTSFQIRFAVKADPPPVAAPTAVPKKIVAAPRPPEPKTVLAIANDRQDKPLSCEVAALKMALVYKGVAVGEDALIDTLGVAEPLVRADGVWGDPNAAFVGDIMGRQNSTGYGVHWRPIARVASSYRPAEAFSGWSVADLAHELAVGNPVEIWGTIGRARRDTWQTPDGATIDAWVGEHTRLVIGFTGSEENPTSFIINDPAAGQLTWTTNQLRANWGAFGNSGVVVR